MKKMFIFLSCLAWAVSAFCQYHALTQAQYSDPVTKTIVREYSYPSTISYVETSASHYFALADRYMNITNCIVDPNIFVRDFVIFGDIVYFCGIDKTSGTDGIFGWFTVAALVSGNLVYQTHSQFACKGFLVDTLHSLTAYQAADGLHVVTVGTTSGGGPARGCTIDILQSSGTPVAWSYTIGVTPEMERIKHVCQTDNYIVTSGSGPMDNRFESYRRHHKSSVFTPGGIEDTVWMFVNSNFSSPGIRNTEQYAITHVKGDIVASALSVDLIGSSHAIRVFAHDMSSLADGGINALFSCRQNTSISELDVYGLKYDRFNNALVLLLNSTNMIYPITGAGSIIAEISFINSSTVPYYIHTLGGIRLTSLDLYRSQQNFLCQGINLGMINQMVSFTQPLSSNAQCALNNSTSGLPEDYMTKADPAPYTMCQDTIAFTTQPPLGRLATTNIFMCHP